MKLISKWENLTTTKKILYGYSVLFALLVILQCFGLPVENTVTIVAGGVEAVTIGFYLWKSKAENRMKIACSAIVALKKEFGEEHISELTEIVKEVIKE